MKFEKKQLLNEARPKTKKLEKVNVKGSVRATQTGKVTTVDAHTRTVEKNVKDSTKKKVDPDVAAHMKEMGYDPNNSVIAAAFDPILSIGKQVGDAKDLRVYKDRKGVTNNVQVVTLRDKNGKEKEGYFKSTNDDPFTSTYSWMRPNEDRKTAHVALNNKDNKPLNIRDVKTIENSLRDKTLSRTIKQKLIDGKKGQMKDREMATIALAKMLNMDHITNGTVRKIRKNNGITELGYVSENATQQFAEDGATIIRGDQHGSSLREIGKHDKKMADKSAFDYMTGQTDRHVGNLFIKDGVNSKGLTQEMIGFDHGLSFGNDNYSLRNHTFYGHDTVTSRNNLIRSGSQQNFTKDFKRALEKVVQDAERPNGGQFGEMMTFLDQKIGTKEADAFASRFSDVVEGILGNNAKGMRQVLSATRERKTNERREKLRKKMNV